MSSVATAPLPDWDLDVYYPGLDSSEFAAQQRRLVEQIAEFRTALTAAESGSASAGVLVNLLELQNDLYERFRLLEAYVYGKFSVNTRDPLALAKTSEIERDTIPLRQLAVRFTAWVGSLPVDEYLASTPALKPYAYRLHVAKVRATKLMSPAEESLAAELRTTGASAWSRLHGNVTSQLDVTVNLPDGTKTMPMSAVRNLAHEADRAVRVAAFEAELAAWKQVETPLAAAMNSIKGEVNILCRRRGWGTGLDEAVFDNNIDRETLDAMMAAAREAFPDFRRYFAAKARVHGLKQLSFCDIFAPVEGEGRTWEYDEACDFVATQFDTFSAKMGDFARRNFADNWVDVAPKAGKVDGAYCMTTIHGESRIMMNYSASFGSVKTLAHELGHGYHALCLGQQPMLLQETPSTLAETASIFCETIVKNAALRNATGQEKIALLDACLQGPTQTIVDITSRFIFENAVFDGRIDRELTADELCGAMVSAQRETYGELEAFHPYMWAVKPHYYSESSFYNFPYMFGLLFALGLYARFQAEPDSFRAQYDDLLASTGQADAAELGRRFGFDTRSIEFWRSSLDVVRKDIDEFESLV